MDWDEEAHPRDERGRFGQGGLSTWAQKARLGRPAEHIDPELQRALLKSSVQNVAKASQAGKLMGSAGHHVEIAKEFLGKHEAHLAESIADIKALAPKDAQVMGRVKSLDSALQKIADKPKYGDATHLQDATGVRVVCKDVAEVRATVEALRESHKVITEDNYIDKPKDGYRSYHMIVEDKIGLQKEIQVRTPNQDAYANWAHEVYKPHTEAEQKAVASSKSEIMSYAHAMSDHFFALDTHAAGSKPPPCPEVVKQNFGCL